MIAVVCFVLAFFCGALPFAPWLAGSLARADLRLVGDGNPGAANAWRAGGWRLGLAVLLLDYAKGALPVAAARFALGLAGWPLVWVALAPILGHVFSPFLGFRGGKGLAVTFGVWSGLTLAQAPLVMGLFMILFYFTLGAEAWAVVLSLIGLLAYLFLQRMGVALLAVSLGNLALLIWTHRSELRQAPRLHPRFSRLRRA